MNSIIYLMLSKSIGLLPAQIIVILTPLVIFVAAIIFIIKIIFKFKKYLNTFLSKEEYAKMESKNKEEFNKEIKEKIRDASEGNHKDLEEKIDELDKKCITRDEFNEKISDMHGEFNEKISDINAETNFLADKIDNIVANLNDIEIRLGDKIVESERRQTDNIREMFKMWASFMSPNKSRD